MCSGCGSENLPTHRFCSSCGATLSPAAAPAPAAQGTGAPVAERRLVSVLFADLVGYTTLSEHRDPEEVRDLLSRYFDRCRSLIERYGGTVEKFIGDAVMAVWGTPVAHEDDAERAVRAALALPTMVEALGKEMGLPDLRLRAGVLTGRAAVERGTDGESSVLGDTVNTASRLQSIAPPGGVLVDDVTRRATEAAIVYEDAGTHDVKGREAPVHAWRALRVVALVGGARRSSSLEAPFVGRAGDLELIIDRCERSAREGRARMVCVSGPAGSGKSRLGWELSKYTDGISEEMLWHTGRCLAYGEGVAYWALVEMVRMRARIAEDEDPASAREKVAATVARYVPDERERRLVEPRLAHLLGLEQRAAPDRADLFSGWRLFFERLAGESPVVLVFEDLQWADSGLLEFVDHLLDWSADLPIFVLALGRPELLERRPGWGTPRDGLDLVRLDPFADETMDEMLDGLVPGLPGTLRDRIRERAEGVPLYAMETVRMLLDRGVLAQDGSRYVVRGDIGDLDVPETLHALVAARLDGLAPTERALVQDASVLGHSFTAAALAALADRPAPEVEAGLRALVVKQVLRFEDDPRSTDSGQFVFLQDILRAVAYETLGRRERKARHLAAARELRSAAGREPAVAELLASHELAAVDADPDAGDAPALRASACATLADAGEHALSLALGAEASRSFEQAAELAGDPVKRARLLARSGEAAALDADFDRSTALRSAAVELLEAAGHVREAASIKVDIARTHVSGRRMDLVEKLLDDVLATLGDEPDEALALALTQKAITLRDVEDALAVSERALHVAASVPMPEPLAEAFIVRGIVLSYAGRHEEARAMLTHVIAYALRHELRAAALRASFNLADLSAFAGLLDQADSEIDRTLQLARERGDRHWELLGLEQQSMIWDLRGRWDDAVTAAARLTKTHRSGVNLAGTLCERGELELLRAIVDAYADKDLEALHAEDQAFTLACHAAWARASGDPAAGVEAARRAFDLMAERAGTTTILTLRELRLCAAAAGEHDDLEAAVARIEGLPFGFSSPMLDAEAGLGRAQLAPLAEAEAAYARAVALHRDLDTPFGLAQALLGQAEALLARGDEPTAGPLLEEARELFTALGAAGWVQRASRAVPAAA
jgi:class 3 adenylate cyclase/tetratricopeptide (TPR) repeat protein